MALFKLIVNVTAASMTVVQSFFHRCQLVGCSGSVGPSQVWKSWASLLLSFFSSCCFSTSSSSFKVGGDAFSTWNTLSAGEDKAIGLGGCEGSLLMDAGGEVLEVEVEVEVDSELILGRIGMGMAFW